MIYARCIDLTRLGGLTEPVWLLLQLLCRTLTGALSDATPAGIADVILGIHHVIGGFSANIGL